MKMDKMSLIRTLVLLLGLINMALNGFGHNPLPIDDEQLSTVIAVVWAFVAAIWAWWKNNYISPKGLKQKEVLDANGLYKP